MNRRTSLVAFVLLGIATSATAVDRARIVNADKEPGSWLTHARNYAEDRQSPLTTIKPDNVSKLGLAWYFDTGTRRGLEASPLVIDGVMFSTGSWSKVFANNATSGELLWEYDPRVPRSWGPNACCDVVNRGVAAWGNSIFVGALDGRLIALDRASGELQWETLTIDPSWPYTITGAPRAINGKVIIGNGGAEYGVRGYISAYDAASGELVWRFYTVPGDPAQPYESDVMRMAAETWTGDVYWKVGGGGTVWDSMAYDPDLNLLYFGVGNGSPWSRHIRSPDGGDNLFLSSIVAVNADTGAYAWHYQTTPGDTWDYTATQHIILADLEIEGETRQVLMQAPKNGFFYVIDRSNGELISAENFTAVSWASHVDMATGRPVETANADQASKDQWTIPNPQGGHNWHPMAFNRETGLVYIPAQKNRFLFSTTRQFKQRSGAGWNTGQKEASEEMEGEERMPPELAVLILEKAFSGRLIAWDPVAQEERWGVDHQTMGNGGVLTTRSGLVFQGTGDGRFVAYDAASGKVLWQTDTQGGVVAPPVSYEIAGVQYVAVMAGWGGAAGILNFPGDVEVPIRGRMLVYKLGGEVKLPPVPEPLPIPQPPPRQGSEDSIARGGLLYSDNCEICHGIHSAGGTIITDLRYMGTASHARFQQIVLGGVLASVGMKNFAGQLNPAEVEDIHNYLIEVANLEWEARQPQSWWEGIRAWWNERRNDAKADAWLRENTPPTR